MTRVAATTANLIRWEWFRLKRRAGFWVYVGITALFVVVVLAGGAAFQKLVQDVPRMSAAGYVELTGDALFSLGPFLAIVLAAILFGGEFGWGTWRALLARGLPRPVTIAAKLLLAVAILLCIWIVAWCLSAAAGLIAGSGSAGMDGQSWGAGTATFLVGFVSACTYLSLTTLLGVVGRSSALAIGVVIGIVVAESTAYPLAELAAEFFLDFDVHQITRWTLWGTTRGLKGDDDLNAFVFLPVLAAYTVLFIGLTMAVFNRRDVDSGNG